MKINLYRYYSIILKRTYPRIMLCQNCHICLKSASWTKVSSPISNQVWRPVMSTLLIYTVFGTLTDFQSKSSSWPLPASLPKSPWKRCIFQGSDFAIACRALNIIVNYFMVCTYFWVLCEGEYRVTHLLAEKVMLTSVPTHTEVILRRNWCQHNPFREQMGRPVNGGESRRGGGISNVQGGPNEFRKLNYSMRWSDH